MNLQFDPKSLDLHPVKFDNPEKDGCNVSDEVILQQVAINIRRQLPQAYGHQPSKETVALVCGGPSLKTTEKQLVELAWSGVKIIAVNGASQWCIDRNLKPSGMIMLDARQFNARFVQHDVPGCRYLLAAQCHPDAFDICRDRDVTIWHCCSAGQAEADLLSDFYFKRLNPIALGTTVAIKAVQLLCLLGFQNFQIFGLDSCWLGDDHHGYAQPENDADKRLIAWLRPAGREDLWCHFECAPWMLRQAVDFQNLIHDKGDNFRVHVHGDGLIATIMRISAILGSTPLTISEEE
jgi:hypothetical protein